MRKLAIALVAWGGLLLACPLFAATGGVAKLPLPKPTPPPGTKIPPPNPRAMTIEVDTTWVDCNGYRPVRFTITPTPPLPVDRRVTLMMRPGGWGRMPTRVSVTQDVQVPAGVTSVTAIISVPQLEPWNSFQFDVLDNGVPVLELSAPMNHITINPGNTPWGDGSSPNVLILGSTPKLPGMMFAPFSRSTESVIIVGLQPTLTPGVATPAGVGMPGGKFAGVTGIPSHDDLPTRWIDYSGLDIVYIELPELQTFIEENPEQWKAIRQWVNTGGNLWVAGAGKQFQRIGQLEKMLDLPSGSGDGDPPGWDAPNEARPIDQLTGLGNRNAYSPPQPVQPTTGKKPPKRNLPEEPLFRMRSLGRGQVLAFGHDDPLNDLQRQESWNFIFNCVGPERWSWYRRHGITLARENADFWSFLIPGVGLAPVTEFQILITIFVLAIGPLNFYLLRRWHKLNLMVITVPVSALAVTGALLIYALIADGLSVRTRARTLTQIDQRTGEAVCWSRLSYYAGLRPSKGLSFSTDTAVYPIEHFADGNNYNSRSQRHIDWRQKQELGSGWLNARTPTQLLTVSSWASEHKLMVAEPDNSEPVVLNKLGTRIEKLLLVDSKGDVFIADEILPDAKTTLKPLSRKTASGLLTSTFQRNQLNRPPGMSDYSYSMFGMRRRYNNYYYSATGYDMDVTTMHTSVLERGFVDLTGGDHPQLDQPRTYVAIVERSPETSFGLDKFDEEASLHVIMGNW